MPSIRVDEEVMGELQKRAFDLGLVFTTPNQVLRELLGLVKAGNRKRSQIGPDAKEELPTISLSQEETSRQEANKMPSSEDPEVQSLLDQLLPTILELLNESGSILRYAPESRKWVARPHNFVTIIVQDARARNLSLSVYGKPDDLRSLAPTLNIKRGRTTSYSSFNIASLAQVSSAAQVIRRAYHLKMRTAK